MIDVAELRSLLDDPGVDPHRGQTDLTEAFMKQPYSDDARARAWCDANECVFAGIVSRPGLGPCVSFFRIAQSGGLDFIPVSDLPHPAPELIEAMGFTRTP